jgi:hypothetical protein
VLKVRLVLVLILKKGDLIVATDMQDDLRKMIERLLNQKRPEKRPGRPIKRKPRQIGIDVGPLPDSPKRPRPRPTQRPRPMPMPRGPKGDGPKTTTNANAKRS